MPIYDSFPFYRGKRARLPKKVLAIAVLHFCLNHWEVKLLQDQDRIPKLKSGQSNRQRYQGRSVGLAVNKEYGQAALKQFSIQFILNLRNTPKMQSPILPPQKIRFNNGRTFFLPPSPQIMPNLPPSLLHSQARTEFRPPIRDRHHPTQQILMNSLPLQQRLTPVFVAPTTLVNSPPQSLNASQRKKQTFLYLKDSNRSSCSNFGQLSSDGKVAKKNRIFQGKSGEKSVVRGRDKSGNSNNFNSGFSPQNNANRRVIFEQQKYVTSQAYINFARQGAEGSQQIPSYFRMQRPPPIKTQLFTPVRHISDQSPSTHCFKRFTSTSLQSFNRLPQTITNIELQGKSRKESANCLESQPQQHYESTFRNAKHIVKEVKIKRKNEKEQPLKGSLLNFCEQSTLRIKKDAEQNHISVSNIEQDNSFSRYYDSKDDFLPLLNRISYENIQIDKKSEASEDEIVTPNLFMDFDKVASPGFKRKQQSQIVHYDCTLQQQQPDLFPRQNPRSLLASAGPVCLVLLTVLLLLVQAVL